VFLLVLSSPAAMAQTPGWWMREPIRLVQTNLRETDAALDPALLVSRLRAFRANVLLLGMGGIVAYYPTGVAFHYPSPYLPPGSDTFGAVLKLAHANGIRVVGRLDLSKTHKEVYEAHPEWFFRRASGDPVVYNGLYSTCINGGYYGDKGMEILSEALEKYDVDGLFFNMFGNQTTDYSGRSVGICQCDNCRRAFRKRFGRDLPREADGDHAVFMFESSRAVAARIGRLIRERRPAGESASGHGRDGQAGIAFLRGGTG